MTKPQVLVDQKYHQAPEVVAQPPHGVASLRARYGD
jgi:hypothetical protein